MLVFVLLANRVFKKDDFPEGWAIGIIVLIKVIEYFELCDLC